MKPWFVHTSSILTALVASLSVAVGETILPLPSAQTRGGMPLLEALANRQSRRELAATPLADDVLSSLLWAARGVNRPEDGKLTAPSARNWQGIAVYVARADGLYRYQSREHNLRRVLNEDVRAATGRQTFVQEAPTVLIYVAETSRMPQAPADAVAFYSATDTGFISQNVYLFCAANDLATVVVGLLDKTALAERMGLGESQRVILTQPVGYRAGAAPAAEPRLDAATPLRDGRYRGIARGYVADIVVDVVVKQGRMEGVEVVRHSESRPLRALLDLPGRIVQAQGTDGVDAITGATVTSEALKKAVEEALRQAR